MNLVPHHLGYTRALPFCLIDKESMISHRRILAILLLAATGGCSQDPTPRWINGSFVNVRASAEKNAPVLERLVINTPVKLHAERTGVCDIEWGAGKRGFVACSFLGDKVTTLADLGAETLAEGRENPQYPVTRAFWIEPTYARLLGAGELFERTLLPARQHEIEEKFMSSRPNYTRAWKNPPPLKRLAIPEFDAMKALLAKGVVAPRSHWSAPPTWASVLAKMDQPSSAEVFARRGKGPVQRMLARHPSQISVFQHIALAPVRASFFKNLNEIGRFDVLPEQLSAQYGIAWKLSVTQPLTWGGDDIAGPHPDGAWDMGLVVQSLSTPVYGLLVSEDGQLAMAKTLAKFNDVPGGMHATCVKVEQAPWPDKAALSGHAHFDKPIKVLHFPRTIDLAKATVKTKATVKARETVLAPQEESGRPQYGNVRASEIDLDGDGVPDALVWHGEYEERDGSGDSTLIFVNVGGLWYLLDYLENEPCHE
ncbi:hypothetical protein AAKU55_004117 [Oxalobacteraceae bacterium GrIS 1.11]